MAKLRLNLTVSIDGFVAGPNQGLENPLGEGGLALHDWITSTLAFRQAHGMEGGETGPESDRAAALTANIGATIMGRHMFGPIRGDWGDGSWTGWWGDDPPFHHPVFVLTHHPRQPLTLADTVFHFWTDGIEAALEQAFAAAHGLDVNLAGGAATARQYLAAGLVDQADLHVAPVALGGGERLLPGGELAGFELASLESSPAAAHFRYVRRG